MVAILETVDVSKVFRAGTPNEVRAVDGVSVRIDAGAFVVLTGANGSGKTTLLALLGALERPTRGQVLFQGRELAGCSDVDLARVRRRLGFVFQNASLIPGLPVWENITYPLIPRGLRRAERYTLAAELLERVGLTGKQEARPEELSGGEQQRVAVARALAGRPAVLLADEPTSHLDQDATQGLFAHLHDLHRQGTTVLLASHDPRATSLATTVYELQAGKLKHALKQSPTHGGDT